MPYPNPFTDDYAPKPSDETLAELAAGGDRSALHQLLERHRGFIYNVALRVLHRPEDAEDATQESLLKVVTRLGSFRGESRFRTWAYRIAMNHLLDRQRSRPEQVVSGFDCYRDYFSRTEDEAPPDSSLPETSLLLEEAKISCTMGMLLCLDREQRLVFVLGEIFEASDGVGAEVLGIARDNFRQKLCRARQQLMGFMRSQCGLVDSSNPCRCARKTRAFIRDGIVDARRLVFAAGYLKQVREFVPTGRQALDDAVEQVGRTLYQAQPFYDPPDLASRMRDLIQQRGFREALQLDD